MKRYTAMVVLALMLAAAAPLAAASAAIVGSWQMTSDSPGGQEYKWSLVVKEEDGKLSGTMSGGPGQFPLVDPKMEGDVFSFKIVVDDTYTIQGKVSGTKFDGSWKGAGAQGYVKGTKEP